MTNSAAAANAILSTPARESYSSINFASISDKQKGFIDRLVLELEQAQIHSFSSKYRYIRVGAILNEAKNVLNLSTEDWTAFCKLLGLKERVEQRCRQIAKDDRFANLTEQDAYKLHHLTQANMIDMTKEKDDDKFLEMLNNKDYDFSKPSPTEDEKETAIQNDFKEANLVNLTIEQYKIYCGMTVSGLIKVLDDTLTQSKDNAFGSVYFPSDTHEVVDDNTENEVA